MYYLMSLLHFDWFLGSARLFVCSTANFDKIKCSGTFHVVKFYCGQLKEITSVSIKAVAGAGA